MNNENNKYAFFILSNHQTVKIPFNGDIFEVTEKCKELYGEYGYLDSIKKISEK